MAHPLCLISHGETPIQLIPNVFVEHSFRCHQNITIHFFETAGNRFIKNDAGLLCNLISEATRRDEVEQLLEYLDDKKFRTPFATKEYYCKKYTTDNIVPNILFKLEDSITQLGLFHIRNELGQHVAEFDNLSEAGQDGPQWDIRFDADEDGEILGPKEIIQSPIRGGKPLFVYNRKIQDLSGIVSKISESIPQGENINLLIVSCRNFVSSKLDDVVTSSNYIQSAIEPIIQSNYNKLISDYEQLIRECEVSVGPVRSEIATAIQHSKDNVNNDLNQLVRHLKRLVILSMEGYQDFKDVAIKIALDDHLHKKEIAQLRQEMDLYIPDTPGNALTRAHSIPNQLKQSAGGKNNTYSKINCPITGKEISINSKRGLSIIKNYSKYYKSQ